MMIYMRVFFPVLFFFLSFFSSKAEDLQLTDIIARAERSTVFLKIKAINPKDGTSKDATASGFIISSDGYIVTAAHVLKSWSEQRADIALEIKSHQLTAQIGSIALQSATYELELDYPSISQLGGIIEDGQNDFAILRIKGGGNFTPVDFCGVNSLPKGEKVIAVGFPVGQEFNHAEGSIGNKEGPGGIWTINAGVDYGMSGGPLYDKKGRVIGIVEGGMEREVNGVDIPVAPVKYATQLIKMKGYLDHISAIKTCEELEITKIGITNENLADLVKGQKRSPDAAYEQKIAELSLQLALPKEALFGFFSKVEDKNTEDMSLFNRLVQFAELFKELGKLRGLDSDDPEIRDLREKIQNELKNADYKKLEILLTQAEDIERKAAKSAVDMQETRLLSAAEQRAQLGRLAFLQRHYLDAANHFGKAQKLVPSNHPDKIDLYRDSEGKALLMHAELTGQEEATTRAIALYRDVVNETLNKPVIQRATAYDNLGSALQLLGDKLGSIELLHQSVTARRSALAILSKEETRSSWAAAQRSLGAALITLGERENNAKHLKEAVAAFRNALTVTIRAEDGLEWADTQNGLCYSLAILGRFQRAKSPLIEAISACRAALEESSRHERATLLWGLLHDSLGTALWFLGEQEPGTERLREALTALNVALPIFVSINNSRGENIAKEHIASVEKLIKDRTQNEMRSTKVKLSR